MGPGARPKGGLGRACASQPPSLVKDFLLKGPRKCSRVDPRGHNSCPVWRSLACRQQSRMVGFRAPATSAVSSDPDMEGAGKRERGCVGKGPCPPSPDGSLRGCGGPS